MKISQQQLKRIIREEVRAALKEVNPVPPTTSSKEDLTKLQGTKGLGKEKVADPKVKAKKQKVKTVKRTSTQKKKAQQDIKKRVEKDDPHAAAVAKERKRKADKAAVDKAKAERSKRA